MKSKKTLIYLGALAVLVMLGALIFFTYNKKPAEVTTVETTVPEAIETAPPVNPDVNLAETPPEAVTQHRTSGADNSLCPSMKDSYGNIDVVKAKEKIDLRFINVHKKVDGIVYRLRYFLKESNESEIPTYLVYKENQDDEDILTEKSAYKKGKLYLKIEKALGEILYTEEAMNIGAAQDLFLHYEDKVLKDLQGINPLQGEKDFIECRF